MTFVALRDIGRGEELCFDYSTTEVDTSWAMPCTCGAHNCRKLIRSIHSLPPETIRAYLPAVPRYFLKVYERHLRSTAPGGGRE